MLKAIEKQLGKGMHLAAANELEIEWARVIQEMMPSAERVRFTSSGTEATQLAMRLARARDGQDRRSCASRPTSTAGTTRCRSA